MPPFRLCVAFLLISSFIVQAQQQQQSLSSSFMHLSPGLNLSFLASYAGGHPISDDRMFAIGIPTIPQGLEGQSFFFPILSSPLFNSSKAPGFSLGLYGSPCGDYLVCTLHLAVCAGSLGNTTRDSLLQVAPFPAYPGIYLYPYSPLNGLAVYRWLANRDNPIRNPGNASLVVVVAPSGNDSNKNVQQLQLRDGNQVVWNVSNAAMMEMSDSGEFRIYDSANATVFQAEAHSFTSTDILLEGERMTAGTELTSVDSAYTARMEKGGLALYMNGMGAQAPPYRIFPLLRDPHQLQSQRSPASMNDLISSAPCSNASYYSGYVQVVTGLFGVSLDFFVEPQSCRSSFSNQYFYYYPLPNRNGTLGWSFLRLETSGRLYIYTLSGKSSLYGTVMFRVDTKYFLVNTTYSEIEADTKYTLVDTKYSEVQTFVRLPDSHDQPVAQPTNMITSHSSLEIEPFCDVPLACGPLGVCMPGNQPPCSCPDESVFEPINSKDLGQGCKPRTSLQPLCINGRSQPINTIFLELQSTASVFLFIDDWNFNSTQDVDACKQACASNCSCLGVSYQVSTSSCFLIQHSMSLVSVLDSKITIWNYTATSIYGLAPTKQIYAHGYVTHLKVAASKRPSPSRSDSGTKIQPSAATVAVHNPNAFPLMSLSGIIPFCALILVIGIGAIYHLRKRRRKLLQQAKEEEDLRDILPILPSRFSYKQLHEATKSFSKLLGAGGCGSVYAGVLPDGRKVAVKVLEGSVLRQGARQCREFLAEVATVGRTGHHNIVRLVGFCWQASHRILVYEYLERGSLDRWLYQEPVEGPKMFLEWHRRYDVALGVARGLHYLHEGCEQAILHFDIKPQNILLDDAFVAKISDFGVSRLMQRDISAVMTGLRGTPGYIAPEWLSQATVSKKSDVYSMGIVMLEILAGRRVLEYSHLFNRDSSSGNINSSEPLQVWHLPSWAAQKMDEGRPMDIMDQRLYLSGFDAVQVQRLLYIAFWCIHEDPAMRPQAATVVQWLEKTDLPIQPPPASFTSSTTSSILKEHARAMVSGSSSML